MDNDAIREYLRLLMGDLAKQTKGAEIQETEDGPVLLCSVQSPFGSGEEIGFQFEITPLDNGLFVIEVLIFMFGGIDPAKLPDVEKLVAQLNINCDIGSFKTIDEEGFVLYTQGRIFDEELDPALITDTLGKTVTLMESNAESLGRFIYRCLNGEELEKLLDEARRIGQ